MRAPSITAPFPFILLLEDKNPWRWARWVPASRTEGGGLAACVPVVPQTPGFVRFASPSPAPPASTQGSAFPSVAGRGHRVTGAAGRRGAKGHVPNDAPVLDRQGDTQNPARTVPRVPWSPLSVPGVPGATLQLQHCLLGESFLYFPCKLLAMRGGK